MSTPPPVPPVADSPRVQTYTVTSTTAAIDLQFPLYGDGGDLEVWINGAKLDPSLWTLVSKSGTALSIITQPVSDGQVQFSPSLTTGSVIIDGNWRPRRVAQPTSPGVTRREFNETASNIIASQREQYDAVGRSLRTTPNETLAVMPNLLARKAGGVGTVLAFDGATGDPYVIGQDVAANIAATHNDRVAADADAAATAADRTAVHSDKLSADADATAAAASLAASLALTPRTITATTYTLLATDSGERLRFPNGCAVTAPRTLPNTFQCALQRTSSSDVIVSMGTGATYGGPDVTLLRTWQAEDIIAIGVDSNSDGNSAIYYGWSRNPTADEIAYAQARSAFLSIVDNSISSITALDVTKIGEFRYYPANASLSLPNNITQGFDWGFLTASTASLTITPASGATLFVDGASVTSAVLAGCAILFVRANSDGVSSVYEIRSGVAGTYAAGTNVRILGNAISALDTYRAITANDSFGPADYLIEATSGTPIATLPTAVGIKGKRYALKNSTSTSSMATILGQTIDGGASPAVLTAAGAVLEVTSDNANWKVI